MQFQSDRDSVAVFTLVGFFVTYISAAINYKAGVLLMTNATEPFDIRRVGPALKIAFEVAKRDYGVIFEVMYHTYTGHCPKQATIGHMTELYYYEHVKAFIGPACSQTLVNTGHLAHYLRVPMITGVGDLLVRSKETDDMYETTTILSFNLAKLSRFLVSFVMHASAEIKYKVGVLLMTNSTEPFDIRHVGPALKIAFEVAKRDYGVYFEAVYHSYTDHCPKQATIGHMSELYYYEHVKAFIGPACSQTLLNAGQLAQYLRVPMVTGSGELPVRSKETDDMYETTTTLSYNQAELSMSMKAIMLSYNWKQTAILYDSSYILFDYAGKNLVQDFRLDNEMARPYDIPFDPSKVRDYYNLLAEAKANARVFVIFCNAEILRDILWRAYETGFTDGDFVFITMELFPSDWLGHYKEFLRGDGKDVGVTKAYESVLILTLRQLDNPEFLAFADEVKRIAAQDFNYVFGTEEVNYFIPAFYDSVIYLTIAINKTVEEGGDLSDGYTLARKLWNSSFPGITGIVAVDALGNRIADFDLVDMMSPKTREFQRVGRFLGATLTYKPLSGKEIIWPKGLPVDVPKCGFKGEFCITNFDSLENLKIIVGTTVAFLILLVLAGVFGAFLYRFLPVD